MGQKCFTLIKACAHDDAAVVIKHVQERWLKGLTGEPAMWRGVELPKLAYFLRLPTAHRLGFGLGLLGRQSLLQGKSAHGGAVSSESEPAQQFRSDSAVAAAVLQELARLGLNLFRPGLSSVTAGKSRAPALGFTLTHSTEIGAIELV